MDIPPQVGTRALVTGGTGGIGFETAVALAGAGAEVVVAGRAKTKVDHAVAAVREAVGTAKVTGLVLDLASLASIESAAADLLAAGQPLDLLVNNAGVMAVPERRETADGFELTFGTNHLGHFALTGRLLPALLAAPAARVVTVSAKVARNKAATLEDPLSSVSYDSGMARLHEVEAGERRLHAGAGPAGERNRDHRRRRAPRHERDRAPAAPAEVPAGARVRAARPVRGPEPGRRGPAFPVRRDEPRREAGRLRRAGRARRAARSPPRRRTARRRNRSRRWPAAVGAVRRADPLAYSFR